MTEKQFIKKIIINTFNCSDYFFESAWKHIEAFYRKSINLSVWRGSLYVLYDKTRTEKQYDAIKAVSILYEAIKEIEKTGKAEQFLRAIEEASKRHRAEEELKLKILKNVESSTREVRDIIKTSSCIGKPSGRDTKYEEQISLEKSTLKIGYFEEPIIIINGKLVEEFKTKEKFFSRFVRLAVARKVNEFARNGRIYKYDESDETEKSEKFNLYIGGIRQKNEEKKQIQKRSRKRDKELYDLRKFLEKDCRIYGLNEEAKKKLIVSRKGSNEVNLGILPENIAINVENLKKFKSNLRSVQADKYGTLPSEINERLIKDALEAYKNPLHKI